MITTQAMETFEGLWKRRGTFDFNLTYGQALAQFTKCEYDHPDSEFLATAKYPAVKQYVQEKIDASSKIQAKAGDSPGNASSL